MSTTETTVTTSTYPTDSTRITAFLLQKTSIIDPIITQYVLSKTNAVTSAITYVGNEYNASTERGASAINVYNEALHYQTVANAIFKYNSEYLPILINNVSTLKKDKYNNEWRTIYNKIKNDYNLIKNDYFNNLTTVNSLIEKGEMPTSYFSTLKDEGQTINKLKYCLKFHITLYKIIFKYYASKGNHSIGETIAWSVLTAQTGKIVGILTYTQACTETFKNGTPDTLGVTIDKKFGCFYKIKGDSTGGVTTPTEGGGTGTTTPIVEDPGFYLATDELLST